MSIYKSYTPEQLEELHSSFLVNTWSYSRVTQFARNEKVFEMRYVYGLYGKSSATAIAGQAYHKALEYYFSGLKEGVIIDLVDLEQAAFQHIEAIPANWWLCQKTTPTIEDCQVKAITTATSLLRNFYGEKVIIEDKIKEVIAVELFLEEYVTVNGVDIPIPLQMVTDLVIKTNDDKIVIIDHKSKAVYTSDEEMKLGIGVQAMTYILGFESKTGQKVDEVWFIENKYSQNKDKTPQLHIFELQVTPDIRRLYEALLYEPLRRMISAVRDPDYVYLINDSDSFVDKAEVYEFWCRTMISEVDDFNVDQSKKQLVSQRLKKIRDASMQSVSPAVIRNFKENASAFISYDLSHTNMTQEQKIEHTLRSFGIIVRVAHKFEGYSSNTYLLEVSAGVKVGSVAKYRLDLANALDVENVRISKELVVYNGKSYLGIDFAKKRERFLPWDRGALQGMRLPLGADNFGNTIVWDLNNESTPHMMVCGTTGSGKSVFLKSIIEYALVAGVDEIYLLDPKYEFRAYNRQGVEVVNDILEIEETMKELADKMQGMVKEGIQNKVLIIFDEFADAIANSRKGKDLDIKEMVVVGMYKNGLPKMQLQKTGEHKSLEENMRIIVQKGRSVGFRVVAAMQRASTQIITGDAKVNFPVRVCFRVQKQVDSQVVLDESGAESLTDKGDGLIISPEYRDTVRFQAYYYDEGKVITALYDKEVGATIVQ